MKGRKKAGPLFSDETVTRIPLCTVCTGFTPPRKPAKFARKTWGFPSTIATEVATCEEASI
jgi:hypothetical protein